MKQMCWLGEGRNLVSHARMGRGTFQDNETSFALCLWETKAYKPQCSFRVHLWLDLDQAVYNQDNTWLEQFVRTSDVPTHTPITEAVSVSARIAEETKDEEITKQKGRSQNKIDSFSLVRVFHFDCPGVMPEPSPRHVWRLNITAWFHISVTKIQILTHEWFTSRSHNWLKICATEVKRIGKVYVSWFI